MKQIAVTIPDNKERIFLDILRNLSFVEKFETIESSDIPDWHKAIIDQRVDELNQNPETLRSWDEVKMELDLKYGI